ncbi:hypothetical protein SI65_08733 [Aspergillus cristatus]|uniref:Rhodopsin domain-containing protein n=1 Tax=Aspergillus cristatus TaxID=573508 RepID=A0A1E3B4K2_ASPCR|nr:hypothetical protein SI65_08733 [Aspergillus cristatus]
MAYNQIAECFAEYAIGTCFLLLRLFARVRMAGVCSLQLDDAFAVMAIIFFTLQTAIIYLLGVFGNNIGLNTVTAMQVPDSQVPKLELGSKLAFMNWIWYMCYIWCLKGVLLCLYNKLTQGTRRQHLVWAASAFCFLTWLVCILTHICICTPITRNWQIKPYAGDSCTIRGPLYIVIAVMNVISDIIIILIPIPILVKLQVPLHRKAILTAMFSSGIFIMICTILRAYYSLKSLTTLSIALGWANRECFVAAIVVSLPGIKPLFRNTRWIGSSNRGKQYNYTGPSSSGYNGFGSKSSGNTKTYITSLVSSNRTGHVELHDVPTTTMIGDRDSDGKRASTASKELILNNDNTHVRGHDEEGAGTGSRGSGSPGENPPLAIRVTTEYTLAHEAGARRLQ